MSYSAGGKRLNIFSSSQPEIKEYISDCFVKKLKVNKEEANVILDSLLEENKDNNKIIILQLEAMEKIKQLSDEPFKAKAYRNTRNIVEVYKMPIITIGQLEGIKGIGKSSTKFISLILEENERKRQG